MLSLFRKIKKNTIILGKQLREKSLDDPPNTFTFKELIKIENHVSKSSEIIYSVLFEFLAAKSSPIQGKV